MFTNKVLRIIFIILGSISLVLAIIGIALPILPTTPFLLLTLFCYARGSQKFYAWFLSTSIYKKYLASFVSDKALTLKTKLAILLPVTIMISIPFILVHNIFMRVFLILLLVFKYYYFFMHIKTVAPREYRKKAKSRL